MKKSALEYICTECSYTSSKWYGKCPSCNAWNSFTEQEVIEKPNKKSSEKLLKKNSATALPINQVNVSEKIRHKTNISEFDRVLGGGIVEGSVILMSGEPGIGKSTMLLQICGSLADHKKLLYVSGEESPAQIKLRGSRLGIDSGNIFILAQTDIDDVCQEIELCMPDLVVIDSIQTMYSSDSIASVGAVSQVKNSAAALIRIAKEKDIPIIIVGHVNKDGAIAGPKVLEHMVDTVLYFEGEKTNSYRILRAVKNRFGSTNEIGVFEMGSFGLLPIENPSEMLLSQRAANISGSCTLCLMEGTRPILAEVQALVTLTSYPSAKRLSNGFDYNRLHLIIAVLEKRLGMRFSSQDVYVNIAGGLSVCEPASDLALALSLISGYKDVPIDQKLVAIGELGLAGECRSVNNIEQRIKEAIRLGFERIILPEKNFSKLSKQKFDAELIPIKNIYETLKMFGKKNENS